MGRGNASLAATARSAGDRAQDGSSSVAVSACEGHTFTGVHGPRRPPVRQSGRGLDCGAGPDGEGAPGGFAPVWGIDMPGAGVLAGRSVVIASRSR